MTKIAAAVVAAVVAIVVLCCLSFSSRGSIYISRKMGKRN